MLSLAPPESSDGSGDEILQYALQKNLVEVSSAEEDWQPVEPRYALATTNSSMSLHDLCLACIKETDIYGTPLKVRAISIV